MWALELWWPFFHSKGLSTDGVNAKKIRAEGNQERETPSVAVESEPSLNHPVGVLCVC